MTAKVPIRAVFDGSTATGLAEYQSGEYIDLTYGGLGVSLSLGTANQILRVNSAASAVEFGSIVGTGALDSGSITSGFGAIDNGTSNIRSATITAETAFVPDAADGASLGTSSLEFSDLFLADGGTITLGNGQDITITHVADTGIEIKNVSTSGNSGVGAVLSLQTGDTDIAVNNVLGQIDFQAPDEGSASDAVLVAASIAAVSEGDFSSSNNATKLSFKTGASEAATEKMSLSSGGNLTISGNVSVGGDLDVTGSLDMSDANLTNVGSIQLDSIAGDGDTNSSITFSGSDVITIATGGTTAATFDANQILTLADDLLIKDGGTIGVASSTSAITIASTGIVTFVDDIIIKDAGTIGSASDTDAMSISSGGVVNFSARPTFAASLTIQDGGSLGSASDLNAMTISSGGVVAVTATTASTNSTSGALTVAGGAGIAADLGVGDDLRMISDGAIVAFGADGDVTLTHVADTGLLLNTTMVVQFRDSAINIGSPQDGDLDINADDEIELNSTLIDINGNVEISGTLAQADALTMATNKKIIFRDSAIHISSTADGDMSIAADDEIDITSTLIDINGNVDISGTIAAADALTMATNKKIIFRDSAIHISSTADGDLSIAADDEIDITSTLIDINGNVEISGTLAQADAITMATNKKLIFRDAAIHISSVNDGDLMIVADDEIDITSTLIDINGAVEISGATTQTGISTSAAKDVFNAGMSIKNAASSAGFIEFFEDSDNGSNKVTLVGPAATADVTLTLPAEAGSLATEGTATALAIALG